MPKTQSEILVDMLHATDAHIHRFEEDAILALRNQKAMDFVEARRLYLRAAERAMRAFDELTGFERELNVQLAPYKRRWLTRRRWVLNSVKSINEKADAQQKERVAAVA